MHKMKAFHSKNLLVAEPQIEHTVPINEQISSLESFGMEHVMSFASKFIDNRAFNCFHEFTSVPYESNDAQNSARKALKKKKRKEGKEICNKTQQQ